ncbi:hypothetical protein [Oscillatoria sp. CS-180]|uniref:hypothetical protein n=1 Tax=Oscillatoria sp. CS-180 TaxID=3021720 RepID=UPI00232ED02E|nr:hypothetical protein [Oscillatoria sp. CS-180]
MSKKLEQLEAQLTELKNKISQERRRADTRRKVLYGVALEAALHEGKLQEDFVEQLLDRYISSFACNSSKLRLRSKMTVKRVSLGHLRRDGPCLSRVRLVIIEPGNIYRPTLI